MKQIILQILLIVFTWFSIHVPVTDLSAQDTTSEKLKLAEQNYFEGKFDESTELVRECLKAGNLTQAERIWAYKIIAQIYLARNNTDAASKLIEKILEMSPDYAPTIAEDPPPYVDLVNSIKQQMVVQEPEPQTAESAGDNTWLWVGAGGVALIGVITIIALSGGDDATDPPDPLPTPPAWPEE